MVIIMWKVLKKSAGAYEEMEAKDIDQLIAKGDEYIRAITVVRRLFQRLKSEKNFARRKLAAQRIRKVVEIMEKISKSETKTEKHLAGYLREVTYPSIEERLP